MISAVLLALVPSPGNEIKEPLKVGDSAPKLEVSHWLKGNPVPVLKKGTVYVIEFWATWCGPCVESIRHLHELQNKYKDKKVTVIGISIQDNLESVKDFLSRIPEVSYTFAFDAKETASVAWMQAANQRSIPSSFLVDSKGKISFIGHPTNIDPALNKAVEENK